MDFKKVGINGEVEKCDSRDVKGSKGKTKKLPLLIFRR